MDANDSYARIAALHVAAIRSELDQLRNEIELSENRFLESVRTFAAECLDRVVAKKVMANPDIAEVEGQQRLSRVKADLEGLKHQAQKLIEQKFRQHTYRMHKIQADSSPRDEPLQFVARGADALAMSRPILSGIESLLCNVNDLLKKESWFDDRGPSPDFLHEFRGPIRYEHSKSFVNELLAISEQYTELAQRYAARSHELETVERIKKEAGDADLVVSS